MQAIPPIVTHFSTEWSVFLSSVYRLSHLCTLLKPFDRFTCQLAGALVGSTDAWESLPGEGEIWGSNPASKTRNCKLPLPCSLLCYERCYKQVVGFIRALLLTHTDFILTSDFF